MIVNQLKKLHGELQHLEKLTVAVSERFGQLVTNHRKFLMMIQMLNIGSETMSQTLRDTLEDIINNKVEDETSVSLYFFLSVDVRHVVQLIK